MDIKMDLDTVDLQLFGKVPCVDSLNVLTAAYKYDTIHNKSRRNKVRFLLMNTIACNSRKLRIAASFNDSNRVEQLIKNNANVNAPDELGRTALHIAASRGYADVVHALIRGGADPNSEDKLGNTPMHLAVYTGSVETVSHLLQGGCRLRRTDKYPYSPLDLAHSKFSLLSRQGNCTVAKSQVQAIIRLLLESIHGDKREMDSVLIGLSSLGLENSSAMDSHNSET